MVGDEFSKPISVSHLELYAQIEKLQNHRLSLSVAGLIYERCPCAMGVLDWEGNCTRSPLKEGNRVCMGCSKRSMLSSMGKSVSVALVLSASLTFARIVWGKSEQLVRHPTICGSVICSATSLNPQNSIRIRTKHPERKYVVGRKGVNNELELVVSILQSSKHRLQHLNSHS